MASLQCMHKHQSDPSAQAMTSKLTNSCQSCMHKYQSDSSAQAMTSKLTQVLFKLTQVLFNGAAGCSRLRMEVFPPSSERG